MSQTALVFTALTLASSAALGQVTLVGFATADNAFQASISTSATSAGTAWFSGDSWPTTYNGTTQINDGGTYYLHVRAQDFGRPEMFIGHFTLSGNATFANGTQVLDTNVADWVASTTGFGVNESAPIFLGTNGTGPWGTFAAMQNAQFIWASSYDQGIAYFTASFTVAPTPASLSLLALGGMVAGRRRR